MAFRLKNPNKPPESYRNCSLYDVNPTTAFINNVPIFSLASSWGMRYLFVGGEDGFVRKYDFRASINGSQTLTSGQKHTLSDSVVKSGVLSSYWENEQPLLREEYSVGADGTYTPKVSPVYSLVAQCEALWVASGLESGGISIQSAIYGDAGSCLAYLNGHTKTVSDLQLNGSEQLLLSGSWDKSLIVWDIEKATAVTKYRNLNSQISSVDWQPAGGVAVQPPKSDEDGEREDSGDDKSMESLFGSDDENLEEKNADKKEEARIKEDIMEDDVGKENDGYDASVARKDSPENEASGNEYRRNKSKDNGDEEDEDEGDEDNNEQERDRPDKSPSNIFVSSTFNGTLELWDIRQPQRASWLLGSQSPPWCISACFSIDGSHIYAGRRNALVDEYDLRQPHKPTRQLKFPAVSGNVTVVKPMPNNRSLLCASYDNIRMYDLKSTRKTPFIIIPGHHGSMVSRILVDNSGRYMVSATGGRGWADSVSDATLAYEITPDE